MKKITTIFGAILFASIILSSFESGSNDKKEATKTEVSLKANIDSLKVNEAIKIEPEKTVPTNKSLIPQEIDYDGKPSLEYTYNNKIIALDYYNENDNNGTYIRMKLQGEEVYFKMDEQKTSKTKRVFSNEQYTLTFFEIIYGACAGEGAQYINGKLLIQTKLEQNTINFKGSDTFYSSKKCQEIGNG